MPVQLIGNQYSGMDELAKAIPSAIDAYYAAIERSAKLKADQERKDKELAEYQLSAQDKGFNRPDGYTQALQPNPNAPGIKDLGQRIMAEKNLNEMSDAGYDVSKYRQQMGGGSGGLVKSSEPYQVADNKDFSTAQGLMGQGKGLVGQQGLVQAQDQGGLPKTQRYYDLQNQKQKEQANQEAYKSAQAKKEQFEAVPLDVKETVSKLSSANGNKAAIKNQIDAVLSNWDNLSDDQKVYAGQNLIKAMNSVQGADAVGNQEREVLAGKLKFATGNFTNDNPTQFGRDLSGFKDQVTNLSNSIGTSIDSNQKIIDQQLGRTKKSPKMFEDNGTAKGGGKPWEKYGKKK